MRKYLIYVTALIILILGAVYANHKTKVAAPVPVTIQTPKPDGTGVLIKRKPIQRKTKKGETRKFMHKIALMESKNNPLAINRLGMLGLYQFSPRTIKAMGFDVSNEEFLSDTDLQDRVMIKFMKDNRRSLRALIKRYDGQVINGVLVTPSGVLAAVHLAGVGGVLAFFYPEKYNYSTGDSNGATVAMYMKKFGGYNLSDL